VSARVKIVNATSGALGVIEVADVVGRDLMPRPTSANALAATSRGVGHLILAAAQMGADAVLVGCGGSCTSDGGLGCYEVLREAGGLPVPVTAATDVTASFSGARRFAEQKGVASEMCESSTFANKGLTLNWSNAPGRRAGSPEPSHRSEVSSRTVWTRWSDPSAWRGELLNRR
jgi:hypothetical protein